MEAVRQSWTDDRLDDFSRRMDERFDHFEREMASGFERVDADIRELRGDVNALQRTMIQVGGGLIAANLTLMAAVLGLMVTQL
jgi:hypothetical protein